MKDESPVPKTAPKSAEVRVAAPVEPAPAPVAAAPVGPEKRTPEDWAKALGEKKRPRVQLTMGGAAVSSRFSAAHRTASHVHGWKRHTASTTEPLLITRDAYAAALVGAASHVAHVPALSPFARS